MVCEQLLNEVLPTMPGVPGAFWMRGYVWHGGFTIYRATPWANVMRAMGTGRFIEAGPLTRIDFRVGLGRTRHTASLSSLCSSSCRRGRDRRHVGTRFNQLRRRPAALRDRAPAGVGYLCGVPAATGRPTI